MICNCINTDRDIVSAGTTIRFDSLMGNSLYIKFTRLLELIVILLYNVDIISFDVLGFNN